MHRAEIREGVVVHLDATAEPTVGVMLLRQARQRPRTTLPLQGGRQPERKQDLRGNRGAPAAAFDGTDARIQPAQVGLFNPGPDHACPMPLGQQ